MCKIKIEFELWIDNFMIGQSIDDQPMSALETDIQLLEAAKNGDLEIVKVLLN